MTSSEFAIWLKGFVEACNEFAPTPKQWDSIKEELEKVSDNKGVSIGTSSNGILNLTGRTDFTTLPKGTNVTYTTTKQQLND
jgi:hypothetical protein